MTDFVRADGKALEAIRFVVNGLVATGVHFALLTIGIDVLHIPLAALANFLAAVGGITVSFLGNRYFVFRGHTRPILVQATSFVGLYALFALMHAGVLFVLTDLSGIDFRIGFVIATALQVVLSYLGNRKLVFSK